MLRGFGLTFTAINLYTRFFEFFWNGMHKVLFFLILAVSLAVIGRYAERIWHAGEGQVEKNKLALRTLTTQAALSRGLFSSLIPVLAHFSANGCK